MQNPQGDLFAAATEQQETEHLEHPAIAELRNMQPDELSPKAALEKIYQLKKLI